MAAARARCLAHAPPEDVKKVLNELAEGRRLDVLRGVNVSPALLGRVLASLPREAGRPRLVRADFSGSVFARRAKFDGAVFEGTANFTKTLFGAGATFDNATFTHAANFSGSRFTELAIFSNAIFEASATFIDVEFEGPARFVSTRFQGPAVFRNARFGSAMVAERAVFAGAANFDNAIFVGGAHFANANFADAARLCAIVFNSTADFTEVIFDGVANFGRTKFESNVTLVGTRFHGYLSFNRTRWNTPQEVGPILAAGGMSINRAAFIDRVLIRAVATTISVRQTRFNGSARIILRWADVSLNDVELPAPTMISTARPFDDLNETEFAESREREVAERGVTEYSARPRVISLQGTDVSCLTLAGVDLRACTFRGAHNLDQLRIEGNTIFSATPDGWQYTARATIIEEHRWRSLRSPDWAKGMHSKGSPIGGPAPIQIAGIYRALRKGREDDKDEPGAADFYYGEMEMRRHAKRVESRRLLRARRLGAWSGAVGELIVLWLYWLVAGYGLRASRALATFSFVVVGASVVLAAWGFRSTPSPGFFDALQFAFRSSTALLHSSVEQRLTPAGEWVELALRFFGPVLLGLTLLSLRGRVKR